MEYNYGAICDVFIIVNDNGDLDKRKFRKMYDLKTLSSMSFDSFGLDVIKTINIEINRFYL